MRRLLLFCVHVHHIFKHINAFIQSKCADKNTFAKTYSHPSPPTTSTINKQENFLGGSMKTFNKRCFPWIEMSKKH